MLLNADVNTVTIYLRRDDRSKNLLNKLLALHSCGNPGWDPRSLCGNIDSEFELHQCHLCGCRGVAGCLSLFRGAGHREKSTWNGTNRQLKLPHTTLLDMTIISHTALIEYDSHTCFKETSFMSSGLIT